MVAIKNVTLIDGTGGPVKYNQDILLNDKRITSTGKSGTIDIPDQALVLDGTGKTVIPGLIMMHEHLFHAKPFYGGFKIVPMPHTFPKMYLAGGVTTMRTAGSLEANTDLNVKNLIDSGKRIGPNIDVSTPHMQRGGSVAFAPQLKSLYGDENIENWLNYWFDKGVTSVKVYTSITKDDLKEIIRVSHKRNIKVTGHLCSITYQEAAELGIDNLEHGFAASSDFIEDKPENECVPIGESMLDLHEDDPKLLALMELLIKNNVTITSTPTVYEPHTNREIIPGGGSQALAPYLLEQLTNNHNTIIHTPRDSTRQAFFDKEMKRLLIFHSLGGKITLGTDPTGEGRTIAGYSNRRIIEILVEGGFSIEDAIKLATFNGAEYLEIEDSTGTIEAGKKADLVLINGVLSDDVSNIRNIEIVFKAGVGYDSKQIFESVKGVVGRY